MSRDPFFDAIRERLLPDATDTEIAGQLSPACSYESIRKNNNVYVVRRKHPARP